jgi:hypothetical protein
MITITTEALREAIAGTQNSVRQLTGYTQDELSEMIFESAFDFLAWMGCDKHMQTEFAKSTEFWGFWKNAWHQLDRSFLEHYHYWQYHEEHLRQWYEYFHNSKCAPMNSGPVNAGFHALIKTLAVKR